MSQRNLSQRSYASNISDLDDVSSDSSSNNSSQSIDLFDEFEREMEARQMEADVPNVSQRKRKAENDNVADQAPMKHARDQILYPIPVMRFARAYRSASVFRWTPTLQRKLEEGTDEERESFFQKAKGFGRAVRISKKLDDQRPMHNAFIEFCESTTAHGLPMVLTSKSVFVQSLWILLSVFMLAVFVYNVIEVADKYKRNDKIVNVELEFESAPFPAITVCNLNPFKKHLARTVPEISETLDAFHQAVTYSNDIHHEEEEIKERKRRAVNGGSRYVQYEPVYSACECRKGLEKECIGKDSVPSNDHDYCVCNYDRQDGSAWPCYSTSTWQEAVCPECSEIGFCNVPNTTGNDPKPCMCQLKMGYCVMRPERVKRVWEFRGSKAPPINSPFRKEFLEQLSKLGYANMTDQVAITTQTKEKLVLKMSSLPNWRRGALGYKKHELIRMCSFNGKQCDIETEFKWHVDPTFGNCYTFNADPEKTQSSSRAGPNYGLRLMLFVNSSDYLPTTEATGVRLAIHGQKECPFPDTFGYSAPTGAVSSFGISLRKVNRLPKPHGDCFDNEGPLPATYIYRNYSYEPEGCFRSCYQRRILSKCRCSDPRYPSINDKFPVCDAHNETIQDCLLIEGARLSTRKNSCRCPHPCKQDVYSTTYSAAKWPSGSIKMECDHKEGDCNTYYSNHAAMIEIYYEQMSFEVLKEIESYLLVNLVSDIGGQAGLWLGASVLTMIELGIFFIRCLSIFLSNCCRGKDRLLRKQQEDERRDEENKHNLTQEETSEG